MAKRASKAGQAAWTGPARDSSISTMFESMCDRAKTDLGGDVSIGSVDERDLVGLPLPALCLRYLFQSTVLPLSRILQIVGEEGSCKSSFLYEIMRWHAIFGGGAVHAENENKDSPELRKSILEWCEPWLNRILTIPTYALEDWQDVFTKFLGYAMHEQDAPNGPGRTIPICFSVDSIMATAPRSEIESIMKDGHASRGYALAANLITRYMRALPMQIKKYPFTIIGTNHLKPGTDSRGLPTSTTPGGKSVKFMETYEIEMKKAMNADIDLQDYSGLRLKFTMRKNSLGPSRRVITAEMLWWQQQCPDGTWRQQTVWDWDTASIDLIANFETAKGKKSVFNDLSDITGIRIASKSNRKAYSPKLGIPSTSPQSFRSVGAELEKHPEILAQVYPILGITPRYEFKPGVDYRETVDTAVSEVRAFRDRSMANVEQLPVITIDGGDADAEVEAEGDDESTETEE